MASPTLTSNDRLPPWRQTVSAARLPGASPATRGGSSDELVDLLAVERQDDVAGLEAGLGGRAAVLHRADQRALGAGEPEGLGQGLVHVLDRHAHAAPDDLAVGQQLPFDLHRHVDGDGEGEPHVAAGRE